MYNVMGFVTSPKVDCSLLLLLLLLFTAVAAAAATFFSLLSVSLHNTKRIHINSCWSVLLLLLGIVYLLFSFQISVVCHSEASSMCALFCWLSTRVVVRTACKYECVRVWVEWQAEAGRHNSNNRNSSSTHGRCMHLQLIWCTSQPYTERL